jgi:hypothetical protein
LGKVGQLLTGCSCAKRRAAGGQKIGHPKANGVSHQEAASKLTGRLASLKIDEKSAAHTGRQRKFILTHI